MANTYPADYPQPNPLNVSAGKSLQSAVVDPMFQAANWLLAHHGHRGLVEAGFPRINGTWYASTSGNAYPAEPNAVYRIPYISGVTTAEVTVVCPGEADNDGIVKFSSGANSALVVCAGFGVFSATLTLDFGANDYATVMVFAKATAGKTIYVQGLNISYEPAVSPLAAGLRDDGGVAFDEDEHGIDEPLAADAMDYLIGDMEALDTVPQTYAQWSCWRADGAADEDVRLPSQPNVWIVPVWHRIDGQDAKTLTAWVRVREQAAETQVAITVGDTYRPGGLQIKRIPIAIGTDEAWLSIQLPLEHDLRVATGMPPGYDTMMITIWPDSTTPAESDLTLTIPCRADKLTSAIVLSVCIWGV